MPTVLAIDLGTSSCRAALYPRDGEPAGFARVRYEPQTTADGGVRRNHRDRSTTPEVIECAIRTREDWARIKPRLEASVTRVNWVTLHNDLERQRADGRFITFNAAVGYDRFQSLLRSEDLLLAIAEDPDWVREMLLTHAALVLSILSGRAAGDNGRRSWT